MNKSVEGLGIIDEGGFARGRGQEAGGRPTAGAAPAKTPRGVNHRSREAIAGGAGGASAAAWAKPSDATGSAAGGRGARKGGTGPNREAIAKTGAVLFSEHGSTARAIRQAQSRLRFARRARSRRQYAFWAAVADALERGDRNASAQVESLRATRQATTAIMEARI